MTAKLFMKKTHRFFIFLLDPLIANEEKFTRIKFTLDVNRNDIEQTSTQVPIRFKIMSIGF